MSRFAFGLLLGLLLGFVSSAPAQFAQYGIAIVGADGSVRIAPTSADGTGYLLPPPCPTSIAQAPFGAFCRDAASGRLKYRDAGGVKELP